MPDLVSAASRQARLRARLHELGFDAVRFAQLEAGPAPPVPGGLAEWLAAGMHADMHWMERSLDKRLDPGLVLSGARSMILLGVSYWHGQLATPTGGADAPRWARYALHEDYHDTMKPALVAAGRAIEALYGVEATDYRYYVDTGPVIERGWAARAGLGFVGKNAMLIAPRDHGNWLILAAILTRLDFVPDEPLRKPAARADAATETASARPPVGLLCGKCTRCLDACPTRAFAAPGVVDARRCVSYQTIENKGVIPRELRAGIGQRIYGCDLCLEVCPWNRFAREGRRLLLAARHDLAALTLEDLLALTPERFAEVFRRTPIKRLKLAGLLRNACVVAGNSGDRLLLPQLLNLAVAHPLPLVRAHAVWAVRQLGGGDALVAARAKETDPLVLAEYDACRPAPGGA
ncbi:tRNA epoxyqueuosine(34) reductase QueG [Opitutus sp. ER46]|uniref:tRNA epoxyqueuosine(34) reductase QueG n=1 Tax=Opitutus sp. ER46 TaxID=2161864 RepID=UPI000D304E08|nr:tRNA epoxyqueuosine(34) reductase QueG [Opitutus sp. ER46]PTX97978.1 tRNA epoxyqueuosine(34) reductase QueG [Opitutus sp. ER46]